MVKVKGISTSSLVIAVVMIIILAGIFLFVRVTFIENVNGEETFLIENYVSQNPKITIPAGFGIVKEMNDNITGEKIETIANLNEYLNILTEENINKGIVIQDKNGNQFVWIPCSIGEIENKVKYSRYVFNEEGYEEVGQGPITDPLLKAKGNYRLFNESAEEDVNFERIDSVTNHGGFYIGRYEAGVNEARNNKEKETESVLCKMGLNIYNFVTRRQATELAKDMYKDSNSVISGLVTSYEWDTILRLLYEKGVNVVNSSSWGNHFSETEEESTGDLKGQLKVTGSDEKYKVYNIYDLAGNGAEWTTEFCGNVEFPCVARGGNFTISGEEIPVSIRMSYSEESSFKNITFRPVLYVK